MTEQTKDYSVTAGTLSSAAPALVLIFEAGRTACRLLPMGAKPTLAIGRDASNVVALPQDDRMSKRHAQITATADGFEIEDLQSRNGTFVDGHELRDAKRTATGDAVVVVGSSIFLAVRDASRFGGGPVEVTDIVLDPQTRAALRRVESIAKKRHPLVIFAETGAGKDHAASVYHRAARPRGPFVVFNCNNIDPQLADAKLFGALKGSHSTATRDTQGAFQDASGGVLFLDEVQDLAPAVQGKLLRAVEAQEIMPVGATKPIKVDVQIVCATNVAIRVAVEEGRFRRDLFHRLAQSEVELPPLRARLEAVPHLIALELARYGGALRARFDFIEACLLRPWPGNVRELFGAVKVAIENAEAEARERGVAVERLTAKHLPRHAGFAARIPSARGSTPSATPESEPAAPLLRKREMQRENFRKVYLEVMSSRQGERVTVLMEEIAKRVGISPSTGFEWAKELRAGKSK
ncbi:MAG: sigma 54-interacting transcriptional regulator [Deltaproteobacteria bacterium]|nr:sigma 54-interacting transcriptional regulator [Deltaproteobacteria bacterium]